MTLTACSPAACRSACGNSSRGDPVDLWIGTAREGTARTFGTGIAAAEEGWLSLTPIHLDMTHAAGLAAHKVAGVRAAIEATGAALLYLPPYSPDLNPIEQAFAKLKALLRKAAARTVEQLWSAIAHAIHQFSPDECANFFTNSGYEPI